MNSPKPKSVVLKPESPASQVGWFLLSWFVTLIAGIILCLAIFWLAIFMVGTYDQEWTLQGSARALIVYGFIACATVFMIVRALRRFKHPYIRFTRIALWVGLGLNGLVLIIGITMAIVTTVQREVAGGVSKCDQLNIGQSNLLSATVPIATDKDVTGTAFAINDQGDYLTAYHVIEGAQSIYINTTEGKSPLTIVKTDPALDVALLSGPVNQDPLHLSARYEQADEVYALGYPDNAFIAGYASLSHGIISRLISNEDLKLMSEDVPGGLSIVQTDAAVNPGNSGGPLVGRCGVVGIVTSISSVYGDDAYGLESEQGISYAVSAQSIAQHFNLAIQK